VIRYAVSVRTSRLLPFACAVVVFLTAVAWAGGTDAWKLFKPKGSIFSVSMPGNPTVQTQSMSDPESGKIDMKVYMLGE
jgi:hypothetical protein